MTTTNEIPVNWGVLAKDISDQDIAKMRALIKTHFAHLGDIDEVFGLPYTSTGAFAGIWNTNSEVKHDGDKYVQGFALTNTGDVVLLADEVDETEHTYNLGNIRERSVKTIDVNALEWFDKVNGNSYFAATVTVNFGLPDAETLTLPYEYGYGDQYMHAAHQALQNAGFLPKTDGYKALTNVCRDRGIILRYSKRENCKKRELKNI